jgi:hypothetical protein
MSIFTPENILMSYANTTYSSTHAKINTTLSSKSEN